MCGRVFTIIKTDLTFRKVIYKMTIFMEKSMRNRDNFIKREIKLAISHYVNKQLSRNSHKSYFHRRLYQLVRQFLNRYIR